MPRNVVVVGNSRGLDVQIARRFIREGDTVIVAESGSASHHFALGELRSSGVVAVDDFDVDDQRSVEAVVTTLEMNYGPVDVWVNVATLDPTGAAELLAWGEWDDCLSGVLSAAFRCSQTVGRKMLQRGKGVIVNVSSSAGYFPTDGHAPSSVASAGLVMLTQALGIEWAARGVRVVGVAPGVIGDPSGAVQKLEHVPMRRPGTFDEIAEAVVFLASDAASYIVGETIRVDGGWTAYQLF